MNINFRLYYQLLELQSRYKNDKRFHLNERFLNDPVQDDAHENGYGENEAEHDETSLVKEKKRELEILDEVLGKFTGKPNKKAKAERYFYKGNLFTYLSYYFLVKRS